MVLQGVERYGKLIVATPGKTISKVTPALAEGLLFRLLVLGDRRLGRTSAERNLVAHQAAWIGGVEMAATATQNGIRLSPAYGRVAVRGVPRAHASFMVPLYGLGAKARKSTTPDSRLYIAPAIFTTPVVSSSAMTALRLWIPAMVSSTFFRATASTKA